MKLILNDTKITNVRELINANLTNDNDKDCDFVITQDCLAEVAKIISEYNITIDRLKQIEKLISNLPSIEASHQEELEILSKAGDILTKNPPLTRKIIDEVDRTLAKSGIHRQTEVEDDGTITYPKKAILDKDREEIKKELEKNYNIDGAYLCTSPANVTYLCKYEKNDNWSCFDFKQIGIVKDGVFVETYDKMHWAITSFNKIVECPLELLEKFSKSDKWIIGGNEVK